MRLVSTPVPPKAGPSPVTNDSANTVGDIGAPIDVAWNADPIEDVDVLVIGGGISGLGVAAFLQETDPARQVVVLEQNAEPGGYCRTVEQDGFVFDYSGHFFHFRDAALQAFLAARLPKDTLHTIRRRARVIDRHGDEVGFPYQRHLGELPPARFRDLLVDLWRASQSASERAPAGSSLDAHLRATLGDGLVDAFLAPYNEKLYGVPLAELDASAMGRFFPKVHFDDVMRTLAGDDVDTGYNATFTYPRTGAVTYVNALLSRLPDECVRLQTPALGIDLASKTLVTPTGRLRYRHLVNTSPLPRFQTLCGEIPSTSLRANRVLVFNLGFDAKGRDDVHWLYVAGDDVPFYRVGFYDNIFDDQRMALYVEIGLPPAAASSAVDDPVDVDALYDKTLAGLRALGIVGSQKVISRHQVLMDPAYVHLTPAGMATTSALLSRYREQGVHSIGRYGAWTYCSIEDNLLEARTVVADLVR